MDASTQITELLSLCEDEIKKEIKEEITEKNLNIIIEESSFFSESFVASTSNVPIIKLEDDDDPKEVKMKPIPALQRIENHQPCNRVIMFKALPSMQHKPPQSSTGMSQIQQRPKLPSKFPKIQQQQKSKILVIHGPRPPNLFNVPKVVKFLKPTRFIPGDSKLLPSKPIFIESKPLIPIKKEESTTSKAITMTERQQQSIIKKAPPSKKVKFSGFKIFLRQYRQRNYKQLVIFDDKNPELCYVYKSYSPEGNTYFCVACKNANKSKKYLVTAKVVNHKLIGEYLLLNRKTHICALKKFVEEKFETKIIQKPNFELDVFTRDDGTQIKRLTIYTSETHESCYIYNYNSHSNIYFCIKCLKAKSKCQRHVNAKIYSNEFGENFVELSEIGHSCKPWPREITLKPNEFELRPVPNKKKPNLFIPHSIHKNLFYEFSSISDLGFQCLGCCSLQSTKGCIGKKISPVGATIFGNINEGNYYIKLQNHPHSCKLDEEGANS